MDYPGNPPMTKQDLLALAISATALIIALLSFSKKE